jgi:DNA-binding MarR family transcriptional regulator
MSQSSDADELRLVVQRLARRIRANRADDAVSDSWISVLFQLEQHGQRTPGQLAEHDRVTPPSINRTVNALEQAGLLSRRPDADDARRVQLQLTPAGLEQVAETRRRRTAWFTRQLSNLDPEERRALEAVTPLLRRLADS